MPSLNIEYKGGKDTLQESTLFIAIDDTGHEEFKDPNYQVFGIGGCAFLVRDYQRLIETPWNYICASHFQGVQRPMHACDLRQPTKKQIEVLNKFFESFKFFRIAVTASINTNKEVDNDFIDIVGSCLLQRICEVGKCAEFDRVFVLFEESDRIQNRVMRSMHGKKLVRDGVEIDIELGVMPKSACFPPLEVADFIVHTAGAQTQRRISGKQGFRKDFEKIFRSVDKRITISFMDITKVNNLKGAGSH